MFYFFPKKGENNVPVIDIKKDKDKSRRQKGKTKKYQRCFDGTQICSMIHIWYKTSENWMQQNLVLWCSCFIFLSKYLLHHTVNDSEHSWVEGSGSRGLAVASENIYCCNREGSWLVPSRYFTLFTGLVIQQLFDGWMFCVGRTFTIPRRCVLVILLLPCL